MNVIMMKFSYDFLLNRYNSNVIRLANNNLVDTTGLYQMALDVVEFPEDIAWLDLSFNEIGAVSDDILEFPGNFLTNQIFSDFI